VHQVGDKKLYYDARSTNHQGWQKESWQTIEETSRYARPERVKQVAQLHDIYDDDDDDDD
jgi:hypothetical protein